MLFQEDWIMRQILGLVRIIAKLVFGKELPAFFEEAGALSQTGDALHKRLLALIAEGKINEAENLLFSDVDMQDERSLAIALDFYSRLNTLSNEKLHACDFSRQEIRGGLEDFCALFGLDPWMYAGDQLNTDDVI